MPSNEKVMAHLNDALQVVADDDDPKGSVAVEIWAVRDALEMLKEQEPIEPAPYMDGLVQRFACGKCGKHLLYARWGRDNYCSKCGQKVKWIIDREKVIRAVDSCFDYWLAQHEGLYPSELENVQQLKADAIALLKEQPEIVRCKDCKYRHDSIWCSMYSEGMDTEDDWFCADGKRRDDDA